MKEGKRYYNLGLGWCYTISGNVVSAGNILNIQLSLPTIMPHVRVHSATVRWAMEGELGLDFLRGQESVCERFAQFIDTFTQAA